MSKYVCTKCEYLNAALKIFESIKLSDNCLDNLTIWIGASKRDKTSIETRNLYACVFHKLDINVLDCDFEAILDGRKAIELRKRIGELFVENTKIFIYSSSPVKAIVAEAKISCIKKKAPPDVEMGLLENACVNREYFDEYFKKSSMAYLIYLKEVKKLDIPIAI